MTFEWAEEAVETQRRINNRVRANVPEQPGAGLTQGVASRLVIAVDDVAVGSSGVFRFREGQLGGERSSEPARETMHNIVSPAPIKAGEECIAFRVAMPGSGDGGWVALRGSAAIGDVDPTDTAPKLDQACICDILDALDTANGGPLSTVTVDALREGCDCPTSTYATCPSCIDGEMPQAINVAISGVERGVLGTNFSWAGLPSFVNQTHAFKMGSCTSNRIRQVWRDDDVFNGGEVKAELRLTHGYHSDDPTWFLDLAITQSPIGAGQGVSITTYRWRKGSGGQCKADSTMFSENAVFQPLQDPWISDKKIRIELQPQ